MYGLGVLIYFASWLPLVYSSESAWSKCAAGLLAPADTPLIWLAGIALIGGSRPYALAALPFVGLHLYHNTLAHRLIRRRHVVSLSCRSLFQSVEESVAECK